MLILLKLNSGKMTFYRFINIGSEIIIKNEEFYLKNNVGEIEFTLTAEGIRKLALLWILIRNGSLMKNSLLFWDEPETNLNPSLIPIVVEVLLELQQMGVQIFIATHSYVLCKEFELQRSRHPVRYFSLYTEENREISLQTSDVYHTLSPNRIADQFARMYGKEIELALGLSNG